MKIDIEASAPSQAAISRAVYKLRMTHAVYALLATIAATVFMLDYGISKPLLVTSVCAIFCGGFTYFLYNIEASDFHRLSDLDSHDVVQWLSRSVVIASYMASVRQQHRELMYCEYKALREQHKKEVGIESRKALYGSV